MVGRSIRRVALAAVAALAGLLVGVASPAAADDGVVATETGDALEIAGSLVADAAPVADTGETFVAVVAGSEVELPADPVDPLVIGGARGEVSVELPGLAGLGDGVVDDSGAVVYESDSSPVSFAAQATVDGGLQVLLVLEGPEAPSEYRFDMTVPAGAVLQATPDGGALVVGADGVAVSTVAPSWALDANGSRVPSSYRIDGTTLIQVVDHHGAAYPVIADPKVSLGWNIYVKYSKADVRSLTSGFSDKALGKLKYVAIFCAAIGNPFLATGCGLYVYDAYDSVAQTFRSARDAGKCVEMKYSYAAAVLTGWKTYDC